MSTLQKTKVLIEGKTKKIWGTDDLGCVIVESKDDLTAGDGAKHDILLGKGAWSTTTTCNVFSLLTKCGIPIAFQEELDATHFVAKKCDMVPLEVVVRREAHGSYLKRNPHLPKGHLFPRLICEFYLKTSGRKWGDLGLPCDDPMIIFSEDSAELFVPSKPIWQQIPFIKPCLSKFLTALGLNESDLSLMQESALRTFLALEKAWQILNQRLVDFKVEFGVYNGEFLLSDVIDSDSWRKIEDGAYSDKQVYRDGGPMAEVAKKFREAAELTARFKIPRQQVILWLGSDKDDKAVFLNDFARLGDNASVKIKLITCSAHKEPITAYHALHEAVQEVPDSVVIAYIGRSNGAGPMLSANCTVPLITVPASIKEFPEDIWSSLRAPSNVPIMTVLDPKNATLAAMQILSARNPALYTNLRFEQEKRLSNIVLLS